MEPFVGEIRAFGFPYAPENWAFCNGALLQIRSFTALYALIGNQFGGDGRTTFALPNLVGNLAVGVGQAPGGSSWQVGTFGGAGMVTLNNDQMPMHNHSLTASSSGATSRSAVGNQLAVASVDVGGGDTVDARIYGTGSPDTQLSNQTLSPAGGTQPHSNAMPSLAMNYCIALLGVFPSFD